MAWHTNLPLFVPPTFTSSPLKYIKDLLTPWTAREKHSYECGQLFIKKGSGYNLEQSTQPQTIGYSLADSPVGLLAWIYEKLVNWTDKYPWSDDEGRLNYLLHFLMPLAHASHDSPDLDIDLLLLSRWPGGIVTHLL